MLRTKRLVAGAMMVAGAAILSGPAASAPYVGTADDITQMQQLLAAYSNALDGGDHEGYAAVMTPGGHWHSATRCYTGKEQMMALGKTETDKLAVPGQYPHSHMTTLGHVIFDDKDHAHAHETNILVGSQGFVQPLKGGAGLFYTGFYNDSFERQPNGRWLISDRDEHWLDPVTGLADEKYHPPRQCPPDPPGPITADHL